MIITDEKVQKAVSYLAQTDEDCARAKVLFEGLKDQLKTIEGEEYLKADGTQTERTSKARISTNYQNMNIKIQDAHAEYEIMRNKRLTAEKIIDMWRTEQANTRRGNI